MTINELIEELTKLSVDEMRDEDRVDFIWDDSLMTPMGERNITFIEVHQSEAS